MCAAAETLTALRAAVARTGADAGDASGARRRLAFGVDAIDAVLGGGLMRGAFHAVSGASASASAAATGVAAALAAHAAEEGKGVLWVREDQSGRESGEPWPPGFAELGLDPGRIVLVRAPDGAAALKAAEAGLSCGGLAAVVIEPWGRMAAFDRVAGRRFALAAGRSGVLGLLLRVGAAPASHPLGFAAAATRWLVHPAPSAAVADWGRPRALLELVRNRLGALGRWPLEWGGDDGRFRLFDDRRSLASFSERAPGEPGAPHSGAGAAEPRHRPDQATGGGRLLSLRRAG